MDFLLTDWKQSRQDSGILTIKVLSSFIATNRLDQSRSSLIAVNFRIQILTLVVIPNINRNVAMPFYAFRRLVVELSVTFNWVTLNVIYLEQLRCLADSTRLWLKDDEFSFSKVPFAIMINRHYPPGERREVWQKGTRKETKERPRWKRCLLEDWQFFSRLFNFQSQSLFSSSSSGILESSNFKVLSQKS